MVAFAVNFKIYATFHQLVSNLQPIWEKKLQLIDFLGKNYIALKSDGILTISCYFGASAPTD